jgi:hypothetical protein
VDLPKLLEVACSEEPRRLGMRIAERLNLLAHASGSAEASARALIAIRQVSKGRPLKDEQRYVLQHLAEFLRDLARAHAQNDRVTLTSLHIWDKLKQRLAILQEHPDALSLVARALEEFIVNEHLEVTRLQLLERLLTEILRASLDLMAMSNSPGPDIDFG